MAREIRRPSSTEAPRPRVSVRVWLGAAFAAVGVLTAGAVYLFVSDSSERVISDRSAELAVGRTTGLADRLGISPADPSRVIANATDASFKAWYYDRRGRLIAPDDPLDGTLLRIPRRRTAVAQALAGGRYTANLRGGDVTVVSAPVFGESDIAGAVLGRFSRPAVLGSAIDELRDDSLRALAVAVAIAILIGALVATLIAVRLKRLATSAKELAAGRFDVPLYVSGRDEVGDLARALDSMRSALKESFGVLSSERDKLSAVFEGLRDAVMVVDSEGHVRFSNRAAEPLVNAQGEPVDALVPQLRRAAERGRAGIPAMRVGDRVYSVQARDLPAEQAVLMVFRDRTEEARREEAEREFVSNAAHEIRNPLAGISGAIEVLRGGAKDDPKARDHFLQRLSEDVERMGRLTEGLLTLARVEALGPGAPEVVDVELAAQDAALAVELPDGINLTLEIEPELCAKGHPTLLRQVLIGLLSNAYKNTPAPGAVSLRARQIDHEVTLEVIDNGSGIPAAEVERVFERFYRRDSSRSQDGFGLGLAIARRMVDVMEGQIGVASREGVGSTFWVRLPLAEPARTPVA
jgi:signal transduction histidine kinase/HAMP domain-containing protein